MTSNPPPPWARLLGKGAALVLAAATVAVPCLPSRAEPVDLAAYDLSMRDLVNAERAEAGLDPLAWAGTAHASTLAHSADMLSSGEFEHDPDLVAEMEVAGCTYVGENIFFERKTDLRRGLRDPDPAYAVAKYMASPGHRDNVLRPDYTLVVSGTVYDPATGTLYNTQRFAGDCG